MSVVNTKRRASLIALVLTGGLLLTGCQDDPSVAARVGDHEIPTADAQLLASAMCEASGAQQEGQPSVESPLGIATNSALKSLIIGQLAAEDPATRDARVDLAGAQKIADSVVASLRGIDEADKPRLQQLIQGVVIKQDRMAAYGRQMPGVPDDRKEDPNFLAFIGEANFLKADRDVSIEINPRYDDAKTFEDLGVAPTDTSRAVSKTATFEPPADGSPVPASVLAKLPDNLKCG